MLFYISKTKKMKKFITIILSPIILSSAMAAETGQRILENNYEKKDQILEIFFNLSVMIKMEL